MKTVVKKATPAAIAVLRQATALRPERNKASDGLLPSVAHQLQNPNSDHNTGYAADLTHDPLDGIDCLEIDLNNLAKDTGYRWYIDEVAGEPPTLEN